MIVKRWMILMTKKPDDWDQPEHIPDPDAKKPDDWMMTWMVNGSHQ